MSKRVVTLGEIMLRLKSPGFERFFQSPALEATFGGGEGNVALSLANFGLDAAFVTALPANPLADACIRFLRGYGVDTSFIARQGERIGIYFLKQGPTNALPTSSTTGRIRQSARPKSKILIGMRSSMERAGSTSPASRRPSARLPRNCRCMRCRRHRLAALPFPATTTSAKSCGSMAKPRRR